MIGSWHALIARRPSPSPHQGDDGAVAVLVAVLLVAILLPLAALVVDLGLARDERAQAQTAADAAALAAALQLRAGSTPEEATRTAAEYLRENLSQDASRRFLDQDCTGPCIAFGPTSVRVTVPSLTGPSVFASSAPSVITSAMATWSPVIECVICVAGSIFVDRSGGGAFAGYFPRARHPWPTASIRVTSGRVAYSGRRARSVTIDPWTADAGSSLPIPDITAITNRLRALATSPDLLPATRTPSGVCAPSSGRLLAYFSRDLPVSQCAAFSPGIYVVTTDSGPGSVVRLNGGTVSSDTTTATGALFFLTCADGDGRPRPCGSGRPWGEPGPHLASATAGAVTIQALAGSPFPDLNGYAIVADRSATAQQTLGNLTVQGKVAVPRARLDGLILQGHLITGALTLAGGASRPSATVGADAGTTVEGPVRLAP
jgi:hypothetical protein